LKIEIDEGIEDHKIRIKVINKNRCSAANNLKIEACTVRDVDKTMHLKIDREDFLILPHDDYRIFRAECKEEEEKERCRANDCRKNFVVDKLV
jgi:hypothetical protein